MPIEIRELQINVTVSQPGAPSAAVQQPGTATGSDEEKKKLIEQCIEQVMDIINNKKER